MVRLTVLTTGSTFTHADVATSLPKRSHGLRCAPSLARLSMEVVWTTSSTCACSHPSSSNSSHPTVSTVTSLSPACQRLLHLRLRSSCAFPRAPRARTSLRGLRLSLTNPLLLGSGFLTTQKSSSRLIKVHYTHSFLSPPSPLVC